MIMSHCRADFLSALSQPRYPVAELLLRCFLALVSGPNALKHPDNGVKQICIDLMSLVGQHFFLVAKAIAKKRGDDLPLGELGAQKPNQDLDAYLWGACSSCHSIMPFLLLFPQLG